MSIAISPVRRLGTKWKVGICVAAGILLLAAANAHLVYVAITSQPECVAHVPLGGDAGRGFAAAKSSCSGTRP